MYNVAPDPMEGLYENYFCRKCQSEGNTTLFEVVERSPPGDCPLPLYVAIPERFPQKPPQIALFGGHELRFTRHPENEHMLHWESGVSRLVNIIPKAFEQARRLWGSVPPPTTADVHAHLQNLSDEELGELVDNSIALELFVQRLPFQGRLRECGEQSIDEVERVAKESSSREGVTEELMRQMQDLQADLTAKLSLVRKAQNIPLLHAICTPKAVIRTIRQDVAKLDAEMKKLGEKVLEITYAKDKPGWYNAFEKFKKKSEEKHRMELRVLAYETNGTGTK